MKKIPKINIITPTYPILERNLNFLFKNGFVLTRSRFKSINDIKMDESWDIFWKTIHDDYSSYGTTLFICIGYYPQCCKTMNIRTYRLFDDSIEIPMETFMKEYLPLF